MNRNTVAKKLSHVSKRKQCYRANQILRHNLLSPYLLSRMTSQLVSKTKGITVTKHLLKCITFLKVPRKVAPKLVNYSSNVVNYDTVGKSNNIRQVSSLTGLDST